MHELLAEVDNLLSALARGTLTQGSLEWYLQNNLKAYREALQGASTKREIENATRALNRFCTESMDWDQKLFRECTAITERGFRLAK
jgi:hypothetical protein